MRVLFILFCSVVVVSSASAQVFVKIQQPPPNQLRVADLWNIILTNTSTQQTTVYLVGNASEKKDGKIVEAQTKRFILKPGLNKLTGAQVEPITVNSSNPKYRDIITTTGTVPSGLYTLCVSVREAKTSEELGNDCIEQQVEITSPPQLLQPVFESVIDNISPSFAWTPPFPLPKGVTYHLTVKEKLGKSASQAMAKGITVVDKEGLSSPAYQPPTAFKAQVLSGFQDGKTYVWQVEAKDNNNNSFGISEIGEFTIGLPKTNNQISPATTRLAPGVIQQINNCQNWGFELGSTACWTNSRLLREGGVDIPNKFSSQPMLTSRLTNSQTEGEYAICTMYDLTRTAGDARVPQGGTLLSKTFVITKPIISFLLGGKYHEKLRIELVTGNDRDTASWRVALTARNDVANNAHPLTTQRMYWDLTALSGQQARIRIIDSTFETGNMGIIVDDFRFTDFSGNWDFEEPLSPWWTASNNEAFVSLPIYGDVIPTSKINPPGFNYALISSIGGDYWDGIYSAGHHGRQWIGTRWIRPAHDTNNAHAVARTWGMLTSMEFRIPNKYVHFLVGGVQDSRTRVELLIHSADYDSLRVRYPVATPPAPKGALPSGRASDRLTPPTSSSVATSPRITIPSTSSGLPTPVQSVIQGSSTTLPAIVRRVGDYVVVYSTTADSLAYLSRKGWNTELFKGKRAKVCIVDSTASQMGLNCDDFVFTDTLRLKEYVWRSDLIILDTTRDAAPKLWGWADLHTHPMSHLASGGHVVSGSSFNEWSLRQQCDGDAHGGTLQELRLGDRFRMRIPFARWFINTLETSFNPNFLDETTGYEITGIATIPSWMLAMGDIALELNSAYPRIVPMALDNLVFHNNAWNYLGAGIAVSAGIVLGTPVILPLLPAVIPIAVTMRDAMAENRRRMMNWGMHSPRVWYGSRTHQQMFVDQVQRAWKGGMRLICAHIVNAEMLSIPTGFTQTDSAAIKVGVDSLKKWARVNNSWMEIAYTAADARRIVNEGKLCIVIGIEVMEIDRFIKAKGLALTDADVRLLVDSLYRMGVRHLFTTHHADNRLSGGGIYNAFFNISNYYLSGHFYQVHSSTGREQFHLFGSLENKFDTAPLRDGDNDELQQKKRLYTTIVQIANTIGYAQIGSWRIDLPSFVSDFATALTQYRNNPGGHINNLGLTPQGRTWISELMKKGMLVDCDHLSQPAHTELLQIALHNQYPLVSSHSDFQSVHHGEATEDRRFHGYCGGESHGIHEVMKTEEAMRTLSELGSVVAPILDPGDDILGAENCEGSSYAWWRTYLYAQRIMRGKNVALGSDFSGYMSHPLPRFGLNKCQSCMNQSDYYNLGLGVNPEARERTALTFPARREGVRYNYYQRSGMFRNIGSSRSGEERWLINGVGGNIAQLNIMLGYRDTITVSTRHNYMVAYERDGRISDINVHGAAHIGLMPDFLQDVYNMATADLPQNAAIFNRIFYSVEDFISLWERCEKQSVVLRSR